VPGLVDIVRINKLAGRPVGHVDSAAWLRVAPAPAQFEEIALPPAAPHRGFDASPRIDKPWAAHVAGADNDSALGRYLTVDLRLRQIFEGTFRPPLGPASLCVTAKAVPA